MDYKEMNNRIVVSQNTEVFYNRLSLIVMVVYYFVAVIYTTFQGSQLILIAALFMMIFLYLLRHNGKIKIGFSFYLLYIFAFACFCASSILWARDPSLVVNKVNALIFILLGMTVFYYTLESEEKSVDLLLKAIMYGGYCVVLFSFVKYGFSGIVHMVVYSERITNDVLNANTIGLCAAYSTLINIYYILYQRIKPLDILILPAVAMLIISQSRKAVILIIIGVIALYALKNFNLKRLALSLTKVCLGIIGLIIIVYFASKMPIFSHITERIEEIFYMYIGRGTRSTNTAWIRFAYNELGLQLFKEEPILGIGIGNANIYTKLYYGNNHYLHNNYIELLACGGIVGFACYYSIYAFLLKSFWKFRRIRDKEYDVCFVLLLLYLMIDYGMVTYYEKTTYIFLLVFWLKIRNMKKNNKATNRRRI